MNKNKRSLVVFLLAVLAFGAIAFQAQAVTMFVGTRGDLGADDSVDWGTAGPEFTVLTSPFTIASGNGQLITVSTSNGTPMERIDQSSGWSGNFAPGDHLLWNIGGQGDIILDFPHGIFGGGAQVQADFFGPFTGTIEAFDQNLVSLGSFGFNGTSNPNSDNSAVFAGILSDSADIFRIVFSTIDQFGGNDFAINQFDIAKGNSNQVPDAGATLSLLGLALTGLSMLRRHVNV